MEAQIDQIIDFLKQYRRVLDAHISSTFTDDLLSLVPQEWMSYLIDFPCHKLIQILDFTPEVLHR